MNLLGSSNVVYIGWKIFLLALVRNIFTFPWAVYLDVTSGGCVLMTVSSVHQHEPVADLSEQICISSLRLRWWQPTLARG